MQLWLYLPLCFALPQVIYAARKSKGGKGQKASKEHAKPSNLKKQVTTIGDLFPYILPSEVELRHSPPMKTTLYHPGYASYYDQIKTPEDGTGFDLIFAGQDCLAIYVCIMSAAERTSSGLSGLNFQKACAESLRFIPMEQTLYHVKGGDAKPYAFATSSVGFTQVEGEEDVYEIDVLSDFDNENIADQQKLPIKISLKEKSVLVLTNSPYCHAVFCNDDQAYYRKIVKTDPATDLSKFYTVSGMSHQAPYIISGTVTGSTNKASDYRSEITVNIAKADFSSNVCCASTAAYEGFMNDDEWQEIAVKPIANEIELYKAKRYCAGGKDAEEEPMQMIFIEVQDCDWLRICFDKSSTFCENEGNALDLYLVHEVFVPTDSQEAVQFSMRREKMKDFGVYFLQNQPAIELSHVVGTYPLGSYPMHLKSYAEVGYDATKLKIHVLKAKYCRARIHSGKTGEVGVGIKNCLDVKGCKCFTYTTN
ncbi:unnamed protein product [Cylicocyclus nassatus]|uniref:Uncharacterized protein n=1 Tax=Cylicocyclus nassatus TaxID=53992 RepID=A0AA36LYV6_CYLNA|nr:unnamed protein product [Cylicocyclus nassatus]